MARCPGEGSLVVLGPWRVGASSGRAPVLRAYSSRMCAAALRGQRLRLVLEVALLCPALDRGSSSDPSRAAKELLPSPRRRNRAPERLAWLLVSYGPLANSSPRSRARGSRPVAAIADWRASREAFLQPTNLAPKTGTRAAAAGPKSILAAINQRAACGTS